jgi:hypothetical protein
MAGAVIPTRDLDELPVIKTRLSGGFARTHHARAFYAVDAEGGGRSSAIIREQVPWTGHFRHLEGDAAARADDLRADLDHLLFDCCQRPIPDRFGGREVPQEIAENTGGRVNQKKRGVGEE